MRAFGRITRTGQLCLTTLFGLGLLGPAAARALDLTAGTEAELADAIALVNAATTIGTHTITLTDNIALFASPPVIDNATVGVEIVIDGDGFTVNGRNRPGLRTVTITAGVVEIRNLGITGGSANGGGILNDDTLTMTNCTVFGNTANSSGGGIRNIGTLTMIDSIVFGNTANSSGGGIFNVGMLTMTNCTIGENSARNVGGGIYNATSDLLTMINCTVSGNNADSGGGIYHTGVGVLTMTDCIVSENDADESGAAASSTTARSP